MKEKMSIGVCCIIVLALCIAWAPEASAYDTYSGCSGCHPGFTGGLSDVQHSAHTDFTFDCGACHFSAGDTPTLNDSALGSGCTGCHEADGLQQHHISAGVPADGDGLTCDSCHPDIAPAPENSAPPYYGTAATNIVDPCSSAPPPGEDGFNDGGGLDNDGDLLYDENDPDCAVPECTVDEDCLDENACNGAETCDTATGICQPGITLDCDDNDLCTLDSCDPLTGCANEPVECPEGEQCNPDSGTCVAQPDCTVDADCDDGQFCNGEEICDAGVCLPGEPPLCDDGVDCTVDACDEAIDACVATADDVFCDDNDVCNGSEICDPVEGCLADVSLDCDDGDPCTLDSCDPLTGCANVPVECPEGEQCDQDSGICVAQPDCTVDADCDDGQFCNGEESCDAGVCLPGTPPLCDDGVDCTVDTCDETGDACLNTPDDTFCIDDQLFCTGQEICDPAAGCVSAGDPCPEGMLCNEDADTCDMLSEKVEICHIPRGNPAKARTLRINAVSVEDHLNHGDLLGPCP